MNNYERKKLIEKILREREFVTVNELAKLIFASEATVRRELTEMQNEGIVRRTHGGASISQITQDESAYSARDRMMKPQKRAIAAECAKRIGEGSSVFLDSSSTVGSIIPFLAEKKNLSVLTNGIRTALEISRFGNIEVFVIGGKLLPNSNSIIGATTLSSLKNFCFDFAVLSASGLNESGVFTDFNAEQSELKKAAAAEAVKTFILVDSSKVGETFMNKTFTPTDVDELFTDKPLSDKLSLLFENHGCAVSICDKK